MRPPEYTLTHYTKSKPMERELYPSAKGIDCSAPNTTRRSWPIHHLGRNKNSVEIDFGVGVGEVHLRRYLASIQTLNCLDNACQRGTSFKMADIAFDRPYYERLLSFGRLKDRINGRKLQGISSGGSRALEVQKLQLSWTLIE